MKAKQILCVSAGLETIEKLLRYPANFVWYTNKRAPVRMEEKTIINKFSGCYFTSKVLLISSDLTFLI